MSQGPRYKLETRFSNVFHPDGTKPDGSRPFMRRFSYRAMRPEGAMVAGRDHRRRSWRLSP